MTTGLEKIECQGPLCNGVRLRLKTQIADPKRVWCFGCVEHERSEARRNSGKIERAELEQKNRSVAAAPITEKKEEPHPMLNPKLCRTCKKEKPREEFARYQQSCKACQASTTEPPAPASAAKPAVVATKKSAAKPPRARTTTTAAVTPPPVAVGGSALASAAKDRLVTHSERLFRIALRGPRPQDSEFLRSVCAAVLQGTLDESVPSLNEIPAEAART